MDAEGHLVCNHSLNHPDMTKYTSFADYEKQIKGWEELITQLGLTPSKYFPFSQRTFFKTGAGV